MKALFLALAVAAGSAAALHAQMGRTTDWWTYAGDAQRTGWERNDQKFVKDDVKNFQLLWKMKLNAAGKGPRRLAPPIVLGNLIGSRGFKELAFFQSASGDVWSIDADLARLYWEKHLPAEKKSSCGPMAAVPSLPPPVVFRFNAPRPATAPTPPPPTAPSGAPAGQGIPGGGPGAPAAGPPAGAPPAAAPAPPLPAAFRVRPMYMLSPDGKLRQLNVDDASELKPALEFLPDGFHASSLNMAGTTVYAVAQNCGKGPDSVYALDVSAPQPKPIEFKSTASLRGAGGTALSSNGTVFIQTGDGSSSDHANSVLALEPKDLTVKDHISLPPSAAKAETGMNIATPVAFTFKGREMLVTAGKDGRLYLLDAASLGGSDHKTPIARTEPLVAPDAKSADKGIWGNFATWEAPDATRFVLATVWGPLAEKGKAENGSIVAFKVVEEGGSIKLAPAWTSRNLMAPDPPVIAQGVIFVLENGKYKRKMKGEKIDESPAGSTHATLYALDGISGTEIWSSGEQVKSAGSLTGLSVANSRVYFTTVDNTVFAFGKYLETEQH